MARVAVSDGTIGAYVWDYAGRMELMRHFWDAAVRLDADAGALDEGVRFPLCQPEMLLTHFASAGFESAAVTPIDIPTLFASFEDLWQPFLGGQGPGPAYVMSLDETRRALLREQLRAHLPLQADGSISLTARAWAVRATVAK